MDVGNGEEVREKCVVYLVEKFISIVYLFWISNILLVLVMYVWDLFFYVRVGWEYVSIVY